MRRQVLTPPQTRALFAVPMIAAAVLVAVVLLARNMRRHRDAVVVLAVWSIAALGAFIVFDPKRDTTIGGATLSGKTVAQEFKFTVPALKPGELNLRLNFTDRSGNHVTAKVVIKVE